MSFELNNLVTLIAAADFRSIRYTAPEQMTAICLSCDSLNSCSPIVELPGIDFTSIKLSQAVVLCVNK